MRTNNQFFEGIFLLTLFVCLFVCLFTCLKDTTRTCTEKVYVVKNERGLGPGEETSVEFDSFVIPSVQPTTKGFGCIDISYEIRVCVSF